MKRFIGTLLICSLALGWLSGCSAVIEVPDVTRSTNDETAQSEVRPQDDFYRYVNEKMLKNASFDYGEKSAGASFATAQSLVEDQIKEILGDIVKGTGYAKGSEEDILKAAYERFLEYDFDNKDMPADIEQMTEEIKNVKSVEDFLKADAKLVRDYGVAPVLNLNVDQDTFSPSGKVISFGVMSGVAGTGFEELENGYSALNSVKTMGCNVMTASGLSKEEADEYGLEFAYLTKDIFDATDMEIVRALMQWEYEKTLTSDEMKEIFSNIDLMAYLKELGFDQEDCKKFSVFDEGQLKALNLLFTEDHLKALITWEVTRFWKDYLKFTAPSHKELANYYEKDYKALEEKALRAIGEEFHDQTDPLYVERFYSDEADKELRRMVDDIKGGYRELIKNADWLSEQTRKGLLNKLDNIICLTGTNVKRNDSKLSTDIYGKDYYELIRNYRSLKVRQKISSIKEPVARDDVAMAMQMVNACYNPSCNNITITVAIMNKPFYDKDSDYWANLGGLGSVIAHEIGHAFDSNCIKFDQDGVYNPGWIASSDTAKLSERDGKAASYFEDNFTVFGVYHVDGKKTLGENYADLGGMECVLSLAKDKDQKIKIFRNYAVIWCEKTTGTAVVDQIANDEHSPAVIRTNAILSTLEDFYETYDLKEGDGMYIPPDKRVSRWH